MKRGFFGIGIQHTKKEHNVGTLWRSAACMGADFLFTIGRRYQHQSSDTMKAWRHVPLYHFGTFTEFYDHLPYDCRLVGVELTPDAVPLAEFDHPERCIYLLGAEDHGLTVEATEHCHGLVVIPSAHCLNVAVAGSIVMYDRAAKAALVHA